MTQHPATLVPEERRPAFLPELFGVPMLIVAENTVYAMMDRLSPRDYGGGHWNFYEDRGQPLFLAPTSKPRLRIEGEITCFEGEVSAEASWATATSVFTPMSTGIRKRRTSIRPLTDPRQRPAPGGALLSCRPRALVESREGEVGRSGRDGSWCGRVAPAARHGETVMNARPSFPIAGLSTRTPTARVSAALTNAPSLPLRITCLGEAHYCDGDPASHAYSAPRNVALATAGSIAGAIAAVEVLAGQDRIDIRDDSAVAFTPRLFIIIDDDHCQVLAGEADGRDVKWCEPVTSDGEARMVIAQACALRREASRALTAQDHTEVCSLRFRASALEGRLVHPDWRQRARVALRRAA